MNNSMIAASASMSGLQQKLDILADNISNINTVGYKRKSTVFEDLLTSMQPQLEDFRQNGRMTPLGFTQGWGSRLLSMQLDLRQGALQQTGLPTDVAIEGNALFEVRAGNAPDSPRTFTRHGSFQLVPVGDTGEQMLVTDRGYPVLSDRDGTEQPIRIPAGYRLAIGDNGSLSAYGPEGTAPVDLGRIRLVQVTKPELLQSLGDNLYTVAGAVDPEDAVQTLAVLPGGISVRQGFSETSNVNLADEMTELMIVQRAYQLNSRAISSSDQMMGMANNLRA